MENIVTRRCFLKGAVSLCAAIAGFAALEKVLGREGALAAIGYTKEALFYKKMDGETVMCLLCPHQCIMRNGQRSFCRVREPNDGKLYTLVYELACSVHVDPVEKKPLYHVLPGSKSLSIATAGCNLRCKFCQNWQISQETPENTFNRYLPCEEVVRMARQNSCRSIAYTYSEPTVFYEYMFDTSVRAKKENIKNIWVTGGYINPEPLEKLCAVIDAANIDLKGFSDKYLQDVCSERLEPLLNTIKKSKEMGVWVEITNLVVPGLNDDMKMIEEMCFWIKENLGEGVPLHFSRFWPMYKLKDLPPTPAETLAKARDIGLKAGLNFVYVGNVPDERFNSTYCPGCRRPLIKRSGYLVLENNIKSSSCKFCGRKIPGIWS